MQDNKIKNKWSEKLGFVQFMEDKIILVSNDMSLRNNVETESKVLLPLSLLVIVLKNVIHLS